MIKGININTRYVGREMGRGGGGEEEGVVIVEEN
jgi:hypothetical protein